MAKNRKKQKQNANKDSNKGISLSSTSENMPRRTGAKKGRGKTIHPLQTVSQPCGMRQSRQRLEVQGFHPSVTSQTPQEMIEKAKSMLEARLEKPTREEFMTGKEYQGQVHSLGRTLTSAPLTFRHAIAKRMDENCRDYQQEGSGLIRLLEHPQVGALIADAVAQHGLPNLQALAATSVYTWHALSGHLKIYDCLGGQLLADGPSGSFLAVTPEYTIGEFAPSSDDDQHKDTNHPVAHWSRETVLRESNLLQAIHGLRNVTGFSHPYWMEETATAHHVPLEKGVVYNALPHVRQVVTHLKDGQDDGQDVRERSQFVCCLKRQPFQPMMFSSANELQRLVGHIHSQQAAIKTLHFNKTPMLDARMVAIILRGCEKVTSLGIYDCPLIGFGDVVCLLDLIHEINIQRRKDKIADIKSFDFYPRYHAGMPYQHETSAEYGIFWGAHVLDCVQPGFYMIIMKAFLKAHAMRLESLFREKSAFRGYLARVPTSPLGVASFLDALYRYVELDAAAPDAAKQRIIYDLLKPVRIGLAPNFDHDNRWSTNVMGKNLLFCSSCGYETFEEFFSNGNLALQPWMRKCGSCQVQTLLDREKDHSKPAKELALRRLCPRWNGMDFNVDAPLPKRAKGILNLRSTSSIRPDPPSMQVNAAGDFFQPPYTEPLVRNQKMHRDSLQGLPTLADLAKGGDATGWAACLYVSYQTDLFVRTVQQLTLQYGKEAPQDQFGPIREDGGQPDSMDERQPAKIPRHLTQSHDTHSALDLLNYLENKGW